MQVQQQEGNWTNLRGILVDLDRFDPSVLVFALAFDVVGKVFVPVTVGFPGGSFSKKPRGKRNTLLFWVEHILQNNGSGCHRLWDVRSYTDRRPRQR